MSGGILDCDAGNVVQSEIGNVVEARLKKMPPEEVEIFVQLVSCLQTEVDDDARQHIARSLMELVFPEAIRRIKLPASDTDEAEARKKLDNYRKKVGEQIRMRREELGLTQDQLADITGLSQSHICRLEIGKHAPTYTTMERVASALQTTPDKLDPGFPD